MSKLLKLIEANSTGQRYASLEPLSTICDVKQDYRKTEYAEEYSIKVTLGANVVVDSSGSLDYAVSQVKYSVNEAVFGEFRAPLREIQQLLWEHKVHEASFRLSELEKQMFSL